MAKTVTNILVGGAVSLELGPYVTAKGAATFADVGCTMKGVTIEEVVEFHETEVDQYLGVVKRTAKKRSAKIKGTLAEGTLDNWRLALGKAAAALTGTPPNLTLKSDLSAAAQVLQVRLKGPGLGTTFLRTWTAWSAVAVMGAVPLKKDGEQEIPLELHLNEETTGSGTDSWQAVDS